MQKAKCALGMLFALTAGAVEPRDTRSLLCNSLERVGDYNHAIRVDYDYDVAHNHCRAVGRHSFYMTSFDLTFACTKSSSTEPSLETWSFATSQSNRTEKLASLSLVYHPAGRVAVGFAHLGNGTVFPVKCRP